MTEIQVRDYMCWICESKKDLTVHHVLPKHLNPRHNLTVPICQKCHNHINNVDIRGIVAYAYKLEKIFQEMQEGIKKVFGGFTHFIQQRQPRGK